MRKIFQRWIMIVLLLLVVGGVFGISNHFVYAGDAGFEVPKVNEEFDKFEQKQKTKKEDSIAPKSNTKKEKGFWDSVTDSVSKAYDWTVDKISGAWESTKEAVSSFWNEIVEILKLIFVTIIGGFGTGFKNAITDIVKDLWECITHPIDSIEGLINALMNPIDTVTAIWQAISESWTRDVINGDAGSRAKWFGYAAGQIVGVIVGTKGIDKASKAIKASKVGSTSKGFVSNIKSKLPAPVQGFISSVQGATSKIWGSVKGTAIKIQNSIKQTTTSIFSSIKANGKKILYSSVAGATIIGSISFVVPKIAPVVHKLADCFTYQQTGGYFADVDLPFAKCFRSPDDGGGNGISGDKEILPPKQTTDVNSDPNIVKGVKKPPVTIDEFSTIRKEFNVPPRIGDDDPYTIAVLRIDGNEYKGKNGTWVEKNGVTPNYKDKSEFDKAVKDLGTNAVSPGHAEGSVFLKAYKDRLNLKTKSENAVIYVDKRPCTFCVGGLKSMMKSVGVNKLDVYYYQDGQFHFVQYIRDPKTNKVTNSKYPTKYPKRN